MNMSVRTLLVLALGWLLYWGVYDPWRQANEIARGHLRELLQWRASGNSYFVNQVGTLSEHNLLYWLRRYHSAEYYGLMDDAEALRAARSERDLLSQEGLILRAEAHRSIGSCFLEAWRERLEKSRPYGVEYVGGMLAPGALYAVIAFIVGQKGKLAASASAAPPARP